MPVGVFLSGGVDSSLIAALAAELHGKDVKTFSVGFEDRSFDETRWSDLAANGAEWEPFYGGVWRIAAWGYNAGRLQGVQPDPPNPGAVITGFGTGTGGFASC